MHVQVFNRNGSHATKALREKTLFNNLPKGTDTDPKVVYDAYDHPHLPPLPLPNKVS